MFGVRIDPGAKYYRWRHSEFNLEIEGRNYRRTNVVHYGSGDDKLIDRWIVVLLVTFISIISGFAVVRFILEAFSNYVNLSSLETTLQTAKISSTNRGRARPLGWHWTSTEVNFFWLLAVCLEFISNMWEICFLTHCIRTYCKSQIFHLTLKASL